MSHIKKFFWAAAAVLCMASMLFISNHTPVHAAFGYQFVILGDYSKTLKIGDEFQLYAFTSNGKKPSFSSSDSKVASVNTYGRITAKKAGTAKITAKIKDGEASCNITVEKTRISLNHKSLSLENGYSARLTAKVSTGHPVVFKSSKRSVATVDASGRVLAKKPGTTVITATADKTSVSCTVTVKKPKVSLNRTSVSLYRKGMVKLSVSSTSKSKPKWKTNKKSVALVDENGRVTAVKNGTAVITVTIDGVSKTCQVHVKKPQIRLKEKQLALSSGEVYLLKPTVSSGNTPVYTTSNSSVATVDERGRIRGESPGKAYIYVSEDGTKVRLTVIVS